AAHVKPVADDIRKWMGDNLPQVIETLIDFQHVDRAALFEQEVKNHIDRLADARLGDRLDAQADQRLVGGTGDSGNGEVGPAVYHAGDGFTRDSGPIGRVGEARGQPGKTTLQSPLG